MNTPQELRLARVAALVADPARSRMLAYLLSGEYASASELARAASVTPATASGHPDRQRLRYARCCLGHLADEMYRHFTTVGWLRRTTGRAVEITEAGRRELLPRLDAQAG